MAESTIWLWFTITILAFINSNMIYAASVTVENGGYKNIVVAIGDKVPEDANLIQRLKDDFTEASRFLFQATG